MSKKNKDEIALNYGANGKELTPEEIQRLKRLAKKKSHRLDAGGWIFVICNTIFLVLFALVTLYPVINTVAYSFNDGLDALRGNIYIWPRKFSVESYKTVFNMHGIVVGARVTVLRTLIGTFTALVANALLAFVISRKRFLFKSSLSLFWVITMYVNGGMVPVMILFKYLGLLGSFWVYIIPGMVSAFNVMVLRTYMQDLPDELEESAQLDGAGYITIFARIISPLCKPVYATVALFVAVGQWNSWFDAMLYNRLNPEYTTLQYELMRLLSSVSKQGGNVGLASQAAASTQVTTISVRSAASVVTMVPIIIVYPFLQRYFVTGLTIGGVKG
ncbi:MAG: carbohydrate ABC transporter permease [Butyrivibrio sp.]|nr:carbohydrate ABC transporter permease [Lachnospiraceae bacterium]MBQ2610214.1 carbohydrate ABC transporter permease [Butyrivibrio sp.]MBQ4276104.1 carbohydrate ABC transporter permease [Lachnospiraceae bacterium]